MLGPVSGWEFFGLVVIALVVFLYFWIMKTYRDLEAYRDSVKFVLAPDMYNEEIVDWHFYEDHHECQAAEDCREQWGTGRN